MQRVARKLALFAVFVGLPVSAFANGDMGLAYQMFDYRYWFAYVAFAVIFEAWFMGIRTGVPLYKAGLISLLANFVSATLPMCFCVVFLHSAFVGTQLNPNPLMNAVALLFGFGVLSALIEGAVWQVAAKRYFEFSSKKIFLRMLQAQMVVAAVGLIIFLIPERPYLGLQSMTYYKRKIHIEYCLKDFVASMDENHRLPTVKSAEDLLRRFPAPDEEWYAEDQWVCAYLPDYTRFSFGQNRKISFELNPTVSGFNYDKLFDDDTQEIWILRIRNPQSGNCAGFVLNPNTSFGGNHTTDPKRLGYEEPTKTQK
ncbi:MAG: hypothetical protein KF784_04565 [Fimbriimonadaceae bacterium]|nr:hypothetical protein [Fimbriimonadaceae bacterium]